MGPEISNPLVWLAIAAIGLVAGTLGGMLGVGGSVVMIPGLTIVLGYDQHLYQAAAMIANVAVAVPAALRHHRAGAMAPAVLRWMLPVAVATVLLGVWLSNRAVFRGPEGSLWLGRVLAAFLLYVIYANAMKLRRAPAGAAPLPTPTEPANPGPRAAAHDDEPTPPAPRALGSAGVGSAMGLTAGLLGVGGGAIAVPLQQVLLRLPLRVCIANSTAVICFSAAIGALWKNATLPQHGHTVWSGLVVAALLAPTAFVGGRLGASITHRLPLRQLRIAFIGLMVVAAWKMAALPWPG